MTPQSARHEPDTWLLSCVAVSHSRDPSLNHCHVFNESNITILHRPIAEIIWRQDQKTDLLSLIVEVFGSITYVRKRGKVPHVKSVNSQYSALAGQQVAFTHQRTKHGNTMLKRPTTELSTKSNISNNNVKKSGQAGGPMTKYLLDTKERSLEATIASHSKFSAHHLT